MADRLRRVLLTLQAKPSANVLAPRIAGNDSLRERLCGRIDRDVDREADVDRRASHIDSIGTEAIPRRHRRRGRRAFRVKTIERAGRTRKRRERLEHRAKRRRNAPTRIVDGDRLACFADNRQRRGRFIVVRATGHCRAVARRGTGAARAHDEIRRQRRIAMRN